MQKSRREKGKLPLSRYFQAFDQGQRVLLNAEPSVQNGIYHLKFHGKTGTVTGKKGRCYEVSIKDFDKTKRLIVHPVHLKRA